MTKDSFTNQQSCFINKHVFFVLLSFHKKCFHPIVTKTSQVEERSKDDTRSAKCSKSVFICRDPSRSFCRSETGASLPVTASLEIWFTSGSRKSLRSLVNHLAGQIILSATPRFLQIALWSNAILEQELPSFRGSAKTAVIMDATFPCIILCHNMDTTHVFV